MLRQLVGTGVVMTTQRSHTAMITSLSDHQSHLNTLESILGRNLENINCFSVVTLAASWLLEGEIFADLRNI